MQFIARSFPFLFLLILISGCSTDYAVIQGDNFAVNEQVADIENEPVTRLSFVPAQNSHDDFDVVLLQNGEALNKVETASGNASGEDNTD